MKPDNEPNEAPIEDKQETGEGQTVDTSSDTSNEDHLAQSAPADALSRTPDELEEEEKETHTDEPESVVEKQPSKLKRFFRKANVYFLLFFLVIAVAVAVTIVTYLNSKKEPVTPVVGSQELTEEALRQLANTDASVGSASQTLTIQGNAVIDGQTLMRGNLNVAGNLQTGGSIQGPTLTISGATNLGDTQMNSLQVASNAAIQGNTTMRDLSVSGSATFNGAVTMPQLTVTTLVLSGNANLQIPNHIAFTGPTPSRTVNVSALGSGGSASVSGSDTTGTVNINTGNSPQAGCMVRINFNQGFSNQPHVLISPVGYGAGRTEYYVDRDQAGFSICSSSPAPGNQAFAFDYFVTN